MASEWRARSFGELTENLDSTRVPVKESDRKPGPFPYYGASGIVDHVNQYLFDGEYLLVAEDGENLRTRKTPVAFLARGKFWVNNHAHIVRGNDEADTRFLMYALSATDISGYLTGSTIPKLTQNSLNRICIVAPGKDEQSVIADYLSSLDDKIELNRKMNETLEAMAQALFKSWFVDFDPVRAKAEGRDTGLPAHIDGLFPDALVESHLGPVPQGWDVTKWGTVATLEYGKSLSGYNTETGMYPVYGTNGRIGTCSKPLCPHPGVIIGRKGAYRGVHYSPSPFFAIDTAFYVAPKIPIELRWAYYELLRLDINNMDSGSAIPSTSREDFYSLPVVVPPHSIQRQFTRLMEPIWQQQEQSERDSGILANLRDTLLPKLISGELRVLRVDGNSQERD